MIRIQQTRSDTTIWCGSRTSRAPIAGMFSVGILAAVLSACVTSTTTGGSNVGDGVPRGRTLVQMAVSPEKLTLLTDLANQFNDNKDASTFTNAQGKKGRAFIRVARKSSGAAATLLTNGWDEAVEGPKPVLWSPSASSWGAVVDERLTEKGQAAIAGQGQPFMLTPLVIAMPRPMAAALGSPGTEIGFSDIIALSKDPAGWGAKGHPEWGPFKFGKTNPNFSTSGLSVTLAQYYAATGKTEGLTVEDLQKPAVQQFARDLESSVVHYGDTTLTFLNNWFRTDARGTSLTYVSAVAVEEKSVIDYNSGNPDGIIDAGETPRPPRVPLVAIYPKEGTLFSDNPLYVLNAGWVDADQKSAAARFTAFVLTPENQRRVLEFGFRPGNPQVSVGPPITKANGVDPDQPQTQLEVPEPKVLVRTLDDWAQQRKTARVLMVIDVSGSMGDPAVAGGAETKLDLAKAAAVRALDQFKADDEVGLRIFSTLEDGTPFFTDVVEIKPIGAGRERLATAIRDLVPTGGTPLYEATAGAYEYMVKSYVPGKINAVLVLTDGRDDNPETLDALIPRLRAGAEGRVTAPVRVFPIAYGANAELATLRRIAEATEANVYDASDPKSIDKVFTNVVSNF